ncbi:hypothetical protein LguiA_029652 [Lonicera macranthoides]
MDHLPQIFFARTLESSRVSLPFPSCICVAQLDQGYFHKPALHNLHSSTHHTKCVLFHLCLGKLDFRLGQNREFSLAMVPGLDL